MRQRARQTAWIGLLALFSQLAATQVSAYHSAQRLAGLGGQFEICSTQPQSRRSPTAPSSGVLGSALHCAVCAVGGTPSIHFGYSAELSAAFFPAEILERMTQSSVPRAPDMRHARSRAPPIRVA